MILRSEITEHQAICLLLARVCALTSRSPLPLRARLCRVTRDDSTTVEAYISRPDGLPWSQHHGFSVKDESFPKAVYFVAKRVLAEAHGCLNWLARLAQRAMCCEASAAATKASRELKLLVHDVQMWADKEVDRLEDL